MSERKRRLTFSRNLLGNELCAGRRARFVRRDQELRARVVNLALIFRLKQSRLGVKAIGLSNALIKWCASAPDAVYSDLAGQL